jgi:hypothetical protein
VVDDGLTEHTADMQRLPILYLRHVLYLRHALNPTSGSGAANRDGLRPAVRAVNHASLVRLRGMLLPDTHRSSARGRLGRWSGFNSRGNGFARSRIPCSESPEAGLAHAEAPTTLAYLEYSQVKGQKISGSLRTT